MKNRALNAQRFVPALSVLSLAIASLAHAQDVELNPVVVSATRMEQPLSEVLPSVSVITRSDIEKSQAPTLADLLQGEAGVEFGRNGGPGSVTSFFLRGQNSVNMVILVDGVRTQVDGGGSLTVTDLPLDTVERVEVLRGNASALYGEAAIGGVINIFTRKSKGSAKAYGNLQVGSMNTRGATAGYGGVTGDLSLDLLVGSSYTKGLSAINPAQYASANSDKDGSQTTFGNVRLEKRLSADRQVGLRMSVKSTDTDFDSSSGAVTDRHLYKTQTETANVFWREAVTADWLSQLDVTYSHFANDSMKNDALATNYLGTPNGEYRGNQTNVRWFNTYAVQPKSIVNFGLDYSDETYSQLNTYEAKRNLSGYFAGLKHEQDHWTLQLNVRGDDVSLDRVASGVSSTKDSHASSYLAGLGYALTPEWRLTTSISTGFRTPTASELMGYGGTLALVPEKHKAEEIGINYQAGAVLGRLVYFHTRSQNAIAWTGNSNCYVNCYENIGETRNQGIELSAKTIWLGHTIRVSAVSQDPWNVSDNAALLRRAKNYGTLDVSRSMGQYEIGTKLYAAGMRNDIGSTLSGYATLALYASRKIDDNWIARARLENAFDKQYQLAYGYNTPGRGLYLTLHYSPK